MYNAYVRRRIDYIKSAPSLLKLINYPKSQPYKIPGCKTYFSYKHISGFISGSQALRGKFQEIPSGIKKLSSRSC